MEAFCRIFLRKSGCAFFINGLILHVSSEIRERTAGPWGSGTEKIQNEDERKRPEEDPTIKTADNLGKVYWPIVGRVSLETSLGRRAALKGKKVKGMILYCEKDCDRLNTRSVHASFAGRVARRHRTIRVDLFERSPRYDFREALPHSIPIANLFVSLSPSRPNPHLAYAYWDTVQEDVRSTSSIRAISSSSFFL